jgi:hypothetical protein
MKSKAACSSSISLEVFHLCTLKVFTLHPKAGSVLLKRLPSGEGQVGGTFHPSPPKYLHAGYRLFVTKSSCTRLHTHRPKMQAECFSTVNIAATMKQHSLAQCRRQPRKKVEKNHQKPSFSLLQTVHTRRCTSHK